MSFVQVNATKKLFLLSEAYILFKMFFLHNIDFHGLTEIDE